MELHGSLLENLQAALRSMRRLQGHPVHQDTVAYWDKLIAHARKSVRHGKVSPETARLLDIVSLEFVERLEGTKQQVSDR
jgi:hypothetical protein